MKVILHFEDTGIKSLKVDDRYTARFQYNNHHWLLHIHNSEEYEATVTLYLIEHGVKETVKSVTLDFFVDLIYYLRPKKYTDPIQKEREASKSAFERIDWGHFIMTLVLDGLASVSDELVAEQHWEELLPSETIPGITRKRHAEIEAILRKSEEEIRSGKLDLAKESISAEEFRRSMKEFWEHMKN